MANPEMQVSFREHASAYRDSFESVESATQAQFLLRDEIGYADKRIAEMSADAMTQVVLELGDKRSNAEERSALHVKALATNGPYLDAFRERAEKNKQLMLVAAQAQKFQDEGRLHRRWMDWLIAQEQRND